MFEQIVNLPIPLYIIGLDLSVASTTVIAISPGQARDSTNELDMPVGFANLQGAVLPAPMPLNCPTPLFVNSSVVGANGLDSGTLAVSSNYIVWLIGDRRGFKPTAGLLSLASNQFPLLPEGYDSYRLIGFVSTDGATHFTTASLLNEKFARSSYLLPPVSVLAGGNSIVFAVVDLSPAIPTTTDPFVIAYIDVVFTPAAVGDTVQIRPAGSLATTGLVTIVGQAAGVAQTECVSVMTAVSGGQPKIEYKVTSAGDSVSMLVEGWSVTLA